MALGLLLAPFLLVAVFLATPIGKRFIADQIAAAAPASGLKFTVGRIEGDIYGQAVLRQVTVSDPKGAFLTIPEVALDWRPLNWLWSGLDIREVTARRGRLMRLPQLNPGDPDAPLLPDFDIRIDKLRIEDLTIARGLATPRDEKANLTARVDIRKGRALIDAKARLGARDRFALLLDAEPDGDRFELSGNALAPAGGVIAGLAKLKRGYAGRIVGDGTWKRWRGAAAVRAIGTSDQPVAALRITNDAGRYGLLGELRAGLGAATLTGRAFGDTTALAASFTLADSVIEGRAAVVSDGLDVRVSGGANLADKVVDGARLRLALRSPDLFGPSLRLEGGTLAASLSGGLRGSRDQARDRGPAAGRIGGDRYRPCATGQRAAGRIGAEPSFGAYRPKGDNRHCPGRSAAGAGPGERAAHLRLCQGRAGGQACRHHLPPALPPAFAGGGYSRRAPMPSPGRSMPSASGSKARAR